MATEDHDFEEVNHVFLFGKKISWQSNRQGAVGEFTLEGIDEVLVEFQKLLGATPQTAEVVSLLRETYSYSSSNLAGAMRKLIHHLFGKYGLVIVDGNDRSLKKLFVQEMKDELVNQSSSKFVLDTNRKLLSLGYEPKVNPREINLFYKTERRTMED